MMKTVFLVFCAILAFEAQSAPRDLVDEAQAQLDALSAIVLGAQSAAMIELSNLDYDFALNSQNVIVSSTVAIQQEQNAVDQQLQIIKELANTANADISPCTDIREELLRRLPQEYINLLRSCVFEVNRQEAELVNSASYIIDISVNKVHNLQWRFDQCDRNLLCISPLLTEIETDKILLVQNIRTEVLTVQGLLDSLKIEVQDCSNANISGYAADGNTLIHDITVCANNIIG